MSSDSKIRAIKQWSGQWGVRNVYPKRHGKWPDSDSIEKLKSLCRGFVCEIGCGTGRCSEAFTSDRYIGIDINESAVKVARQTYPEHRFEAIAWDDDYPVADTYLFYTVLLHVPDEEIISVLRKTNNHNRDSRLVIFETMSRCYRNEEKGNYQRDLSQYEDVMTNSGRTVISAEELQSSVEPFLRHFMVAE
jgi:SAM-dependent methyltransferase